MNIICFDIEATDNGEMLELSIISYPQKKDLYYSRFRPQKSKTWKNETIHHITPEMVKNSPLLEDEKGTIVNILNSADAILGFAIDNDIRYIENNLGYNFNDIYKIEVKDWLWALDGHRFDVAYPAIPKLSKCCEFYGINFSEETEAHNAKNDVLATINLFERITQNHNLSALTEKAIIEIERKINTKEEKYKEEIAKGYISLVLANGLFVIKNNREKLETSEFSIYFESRFKAEFELRKKFKKREIFEGAFKYKLNSNDIAFFLNYKNSYSPTEEEFYRKLSNGNNKLSFKLV